MYLCSQLTAALDVTLGRAATTACGRYTAQHIISYEDKNDVRAVHTVVSITTIHISLYIFIYIYICMHVCISIYSLHLVVYTRLDAQQLAHLDGEAAVHEDGVQDDGSGGGHDLALVTL